MLRPPSGRPSIDSSASIQIIAAAVPVSATFTFSPDPDRTFNRGYTQYFISGRKEKVASMDTQKSIGQYVGTITGMGKDFFRMAVT